LIPKKAWLLSLSEGGSRLSMRGYATNNKEIAIFMKNLEASSFFSKVTLMEIKISDDRMMPINVMEFELHCTYHIPHS